MSFNDYLAYNMQLMLLLKHLSFYMHSYYYCTIIIYLLDDLPICNNIQLMLMISQTNWNIIKYLKLIILVNFMFCLILQNSRFNILILVKINFKTKMQKICHLFGFNLINLKLVLLNLIFLV